MAEHVLVGDVHMSDRPPSSCTDTYRTDILDLLAQTLDLARTRRAAAVVIAGDLFHCKAPSRTSHRTIMQLITLAARFQPLFVVPGNHDQQNDRQQSVTETQPLGVLLEAGAVRLLDGWNTSMTLYGVPWQQRWDDEHVFAALQGYHDWRLQQGRPALVVTHAPLYPPGKELPYEFYPAQQWADAMGRAGQCFYGHVHEPHGTWECHEVTFCNNGALSRGSLHEYNITRQVGATLWDDQTGRFTFVPLKARPASEVFRLQEKQEATDMQGRLAEFLAAVASASLSEVSAMTVLEHFRSQGLGKDELDLIEELLEHAN